MKWLGKIRAVKYHVLRIDLSDPGGMFTSGMVFRKLKDQIDMDQKMAELPLKEMLEHIPRYSNVVLVFSGDQVLSRFSSGELKNLFEEIEEEDFYFQKVAVESGWTIQSVCRKSIVDTVFDLMLSRKLFLLHMAFDPTVVPTIADLMGDTMISSGHFRFQFRDGTLLCIIEDGTSAIEETPESGILLEGMSLSSNDISMLAGLVHYLKEGPVTAGSFQEHHLQSRYFRRFRTALAGVLSGLFVVLLTNFLLFSSVQQNLDQLKSSGESQAEVIQEIERLKIQIEEYRDLSMNRVNAPSRSYSFYLEEMAQHRPSGVWFNQLEVDPIRGKQEAGKAVETNRSQIKLTGETRDPVSLNRFIKALKDLHWISDIELKNYEMSPESSSASFEITIRKVQ